MQLEPLTEEERARAQTRLEQYNKTAWTFSGGILISLTLFLWKVFRRMAGRGSSDDLAVMVFLFGLFAVIGALAWLFGWKQVFALKRDLQLRQKGRIHGQIEWLDRQNNAYGQTVTHVRVQGRRASSREVSMASVQKGDEVELELLPESGVILSCRSLK